MNRLKGGGQYLWLGVSTLLLYILTYYPVGAPVMPGLDPGYLYALNYFFAHGVHFGTEVVFTYGPLGFLVAPQPVGSNLEIGMICWIALRLVLAFFAARAALGGADGRRGLFERLLALAVAYALLLNLELWFLFPVLTALLLLGARDLSSIWRALGAGVVVGVALLFKSSEGFLSLAVAGGWYFSRMVFRRGFGPLADLPIFLAGLAGSLAGLWLLLYGDLSGLTTYFRALWEFGKGNSSALSLPNPIHWGWFFAAPALLAAWAVAARDKRLAAAALALAPACLLVAKYGLGRSDHILQVGRFLLVVGFFLALIAKGSLRLLATVALAFAAGWAFTGSYADFQLSQAHRTFLESSLEPSHYTTFANPGMLWQSTAEFSDYKESLVRRSKEMTASRILPEDLLRLIDGRPVDLYYAETVEVYANDLDWRPRPVFQSYIAYTPWLQNLNAAFLASPAAPPVYVWNNPYLREVDGRHVFSSEPDFAVAFMRDYRPIAQEGKITIYERSPAPRLGEAELSAPTTGRFDQWIDVPGRTGYLTRARVEMKPEPLLVLKKLAYNVGPVHMDVRYADGRESSYRIIPALAPLGIWLDPLPRKTTQGLAGPRITAFKLRHSAVDAFKPEFSLVWETRPILAGEGLLPLLEENVRAGRKPVLTDYNGFPALTVAPPQRIQMPLVPEAAGFAFTLRIRPRALDICARPGDGMAVALLGRDINGEIRQIKRWIFDPFPDGPFGRRFTARFEPGAFGSLEIRLGPRGGVNCDQSYLLDPTILVAAPEKG